MLQRKNWTKSRSRLIERQPRLGARHLALPQATRATSDNGEGGRVRQLCAVEAICKSSGRVSMEILFLGSGGATAVQIEHLAGGTVSVGKSRGLTNGRASGRSRKRTKVEYNAVASPSNECTPREPGEERLEGRPGDLRRCGLVGLAVFASLCLLGSLAAAQNVVGPNSAGTIQWTVSATQDTAMTLDGVQITIDAPSYFTVQPTSVLGPVSILAGGNKVFSIDYQLNDAPSDVTDFQVNLHASFGQSNVAANIRDTSVSFTVNLSTGQCTGNCSPEVPLISQLSPTSAQEGDPDTLLTVAGSGFASGAVVRLRSDVQTIDLPASVLSAVSLTTVIPASALETSRLYGVRVVNPSDRASAEVSFPVRQPAPVVASVEPPTIDAAAQSVELTILGQNFLPSTLVFVGDVELTVSYLGSTKLRVVIPGPLLASPGSLTLRFVNGADVALAASVEAPLSVVPQAAPRPIRDLSVPLRLGSVIDLGATDDGGVSGVTVTYPDLTTRGGSHVPTRTLHVPFAGAMSGTYHVQYQDAAGNSSGYDFSVSGSPFMVLRTTTALGGPVVAQALIEGPGDFAQQYRLFTEPPFDGGNGPEDFKQYCDHYWKIGGGQCYYTGRGNDGWERLIAPDSGDGLVHATVDRGQADYGTFGLNNVQSVDFITNPSATRGPQTAVRVGVGALLELQAGESVDLTIEIPYIGQDVYRCATNSLCVSAKVPPPDIACSPPTPDQRRTMIEQGIYPACGLRCEISPSPAVFLEPVVYSVSGCPAPPGGTNPNGATCCTQSEGGIWHCGGAATKTCSGGQCSYSCQFPAASAWGVFVPVTGQLADETSPQLSGAQVSSDGSAWAGTDAIVEAAHAFARVSARELAGFSESLGGLSASTEPIAPALLNVGTPLEPKGTAALLHFDEGTGPAAADASGHGVGASIVPGVVWVQGRFGTALGFDGNTGKPALSNSGSLSRSAFTISAWIYPESASGIQVVLGNRKDNNQGFQFGLSDGKPMLRLSAANPSVTSAAIGAAALTLNAWHHIAAAFDGTTATVYADGVPVASLHEPRYALSSADAYLGQSADGFAYRGRVDELRFLDFAQDRHSVAFEFRRGWWAQYSVDGGEHWAAVPDANLSFGATTGNPGPAYLTVSSLQLGESLTQNLVDFMVWDVAGNAAALTTAVKTPPPDNVALIVYETEVSNDGANWYPQGSMLPGTTTYFRARVRDPPDPPKRLSGVEVSTSAQPAAVVPGALALLRFDEGSGSTAADSGPLGNTFTFGSGVTGFVPGRFGTALQFRGGGVGGTLAQALAPSAWTASAWVKPDGVELEAVVTNLTNLATPGFGLFLNNRAPMGRVRDASGGITSVSGAPLAPGVWHHIAATFEAGVLTVFADGEQVAQGPANTYTPTSNTAFIGSGAGGYFATTAAIDEVRVVDRSLGRAEIVRDFKRGGQALYTADGGATWRQAAVDFDGAAQGQPGPFTLTANSMQLAVSPSSNAVELIVADAAGNLTATQFSLPVGVDTTPPPVPTLLAESRAGGLVELSWQAGPGEPVASYALFRSTGVDTGSAVASGLRQSTFTDAPAEDGLYHYRLAAFDLQGNAALPADTTAYSDRLPPISTLSVAGSTFTEGSTIVSRGTATVTLAAFDLGIGVDRIVVDVDGATATYAGAFFLGLGTHAVAYFAVDLLGQEEPSHTQLVRVEPPGFDLVWTGAAGDGRWATAANWSPAQTPGADDRVTINTAGGATVDASAGNISFLRLTLGGSGGVDTLKLSTILSARDLEVRAGGVLWQEGRNVLAFGGTVAAKSGARLTHSSNTATFDHHLSLSAAGDFLLETGATVDLEGKGFRGGGDNQTGSGPGGGRGGGNFGGGGGGHGGYGGSGGRNQVPRANPGGPAHDDLFFPSQPGSGGGGLGGAGGGVFIVASSGTARLDGRILARGRNGTTGAGCCGGGGAGGTARIDAAVILGTGTIDASGGSGFRTFGAEHKDAGGGGGGRVALSGVGALAAASIVAEPGLDGAGSGLALGGAGTVLRREPGRSPSLTIRVPKPLPVLKVDQAPTPLSSAPLILEGFHLQGAIAQSLMPLTITSTLTLTGEYVIETTTLTFPTGGLAGFTIPRGSTITATSLASDPAWSWTIEGGLNLRSTLSGASFILRDGVTLTGIAASGSVTLLAGTTLTHPPAHLPGLELSVAGDLDIQAGARIDAVGRGHLGGAAGSTSPGQGPGGGGGALDSAGGGHGGRGGFAVCTGGGQTGGAAGGINYDSLENPSLPGSGGGGTGGLGGAPGGGVVKATVGGTLTVNGAIDVSGSIDGFNSGGGAGGTINLSAGQAQGSGTLRADGGAGQVIGGGGGAGGRIALVAGGAPNSALTFSAGGGNGAFCATTGKWGQAGGGGTVYLKDPSQARYSLQVGGAGSFDKGRAGTPVGPLDVDRLRVADASLDVALEAVVRQSLELSGTYALSSGRLEVPGAIAVSSRGSISAGAISGAADFSVDGFLSTGWLAARDLSGRGTIFVSSADLTGSLTLDGSALLRASTLTVAGNVVVRSSATLTALAQTRLNLEVAGSAAFDPGTRIDLL
ncbi:MAG: LamG domain-containing protein, partial [Elusimicrobia bacterium]|nr:LamG domain-containing protein [Elusimicrobiota bacterium]